jgi:nucleotide-binding universal stress UspA family protein
MSIVVGVDGSEDSVAALGWALREARIRGTDLDAVYAWPMPYESVTSLWDLDEETVAWFRTAAEQALAQAVSAARNPAGAAQDEVVIRQDAIEGSPAPVLIAQSEGAELLVVGSRGHGGFKELLLGSVSHQCAQHARCPVVIVRRNEEKP